MGNCAFSGFGGGAEDLIIRVATCSGGVMELHPPVTAECVTHGFPGYGVFRSADVVSRPLLHNEELLVGELYYLRPLNGSPRSGLLPSAVAPYRVSLDHHGFWKRQEIMEALPRWSGGGGLGNDSIGGGTGVWRVKLAISPAQLAEILSQGTRTEALIESVRTVAKCGSAVATSAAGSDQWSLSGSRKAPSESMA
ncbi:hypothetical protein Taro_052542 [Colocasia esculenta]|uniref:Uncharacterized protein n=1 Tax=Colocasia esculenta TaxID=4460 RepID=A0A843XJN9_COLES|nr:hypothetical protein [Colocasia esculenta]